MARTTGPRYRVEWQPPEGKGRWDLWRGGLSYAQAQKVERAARAISSRWVRLDWRSETPSIETAFRIVSE